MRYEIIITDNLSERWFGLPPVLNALGVESWEALRDWIKDREVDIFIKILVYPRSSWL